ncbi:D-2-hydroxyacid dehydrogenase [Shewanella sp. Actino-trap-3]|uniref:D-2-hydroxyacid dehydrogenase n=1 Tax=Shewanella sp. Actino-trap-3 TaxID=2058331 RepID=UPI000C34A5D6|nr:D-2-hydroxyacid dehydrogenase [Shewanella sp. Actino-trap-3]PKG79906.1 D-2-hydroxyacid dehydrogenase [Shewanella sp. Actino-trap-3]|tara:strand:+ start:7234 stop:8184 length:951 start_codon:yes stop_codon:yes gene_type:complete
MANKLLLLTRENDQYRQLLAKHSLPDLEIVDDILVDTGDDTLSNINDADIWLAEPHLAAPLLPHATALKWLQSTFAGVNALMQPSLRHDYLLTNIRGVFGPLMSEYVFGYLLSHYRHHAQYTQQQHQQLWRPGSYRTLQGQQLLILGTGSIAQHLAITAHHFGMTVSGLNRQGALVSGFNRIDTMDKLADYLPHAHVIVSVLPDTPQTKHLLNAENLPLLKPDAMLFNIGRGNAIDLTALQTELMLCPQRQAILDVFEQEPLPANHPLWHYDNVTITPHIAAPSFPEQVVQIFSQNYCRWQQSKSLHYVVDASHGY